MHSSSKQLLLLLTLVLSIPLSSCKEEKKAPHHEEQKTEEREKSETEISKEKESIENYTPLVDNLVVVMKEGRYSATDHVRGRDADYFNCYVVEGKNYEVSLESDNDRLNLIIFSPNDEKLLVRDTDGEIINWTGEFPESGNAIFHISLATDASQDSNVANYTLKVSEK